MILVSYKEYSFYIKNMEKIIDILDFTETSIYQLNFLAFWKNIWNNRRYKKIEILKKNWTQRILYEPTIKLKVIQTKILNEILYKYWDKNMSFNIKKICTWFQKWKSILDNAKPHVNKEILIKIDLQNYFPSITHNRIFWVFYKKLWYNYDISNYLTWLCTFKNQLPQWAPTSPMLSNIISSNLDNRIIQYIKKINKNNHIKINYTRYADDITISLNSKKPYTIDYICNRIFSIIEEEDFIVNYDKFKIISNNKVQKVTWIIVNDKASLWRNNFKRIKAIINNINNNSWESEYKKWLEYWNNSSSVENFKSIIKWYISYYNMVNEYIYWKHLILNK